MDRPSAACHAAARGGPRSRRPDRARAEQSPARAHRRIACRRARDRLTASSSWLSSVRLPRSVPRLSWEYLIACLTPGADEISGIVLDHTRPEFFAENPNRPLNRDWLLESP